MVKQREPEKLASFYGKSTQTQRSAGEGPHREGWVERGREKKERGEERGNRTWQPRAKRRCSPKLADNGTMGP